MTAALLVASAVLWGFAWHFGTRALAADRKARAGAHAGPGLMPSLTQPLDGWTPAPVLEPVRAPATNTRTRGGGAR